MIPSDNWRWCVILFYIALKFIGSQPMIQQSVFNQFSTFASFPPNFVKIFYSCNRNMNLSLQSVWNHLLIYPDLTIASFQAWSQSSSVLLWLHRLSYWLLYCFAALVTKSSCLAFLKENTANYGRRVAQLGLQLHSEQQGFLCTAESVFQTVVVWRCNSWSLPVYFWCFRLNTKPSSDGGAPVCCDGISERIWHLFAQSNPKISVSRTDFFFLSNVIKKE